MANWRCAGVLAAAAAMAGTTPAAAQVWFDMPALMSPVVTNPCPDGRCPAVESEPEPASPQGDEAPALGAVLQRVVQGSSGAVAGQAGPATFPYRPSISRREARLAEFVASVRMRDAAEADALAALFASTNIFAQIDTVMQTAGLTATNLADACTLWWIIAWHGAQGAEATLDPAQAAAVRRQAGAALAAVPALARNDDAMRQMMAEEMLLQALLMDQAVTAAAKDAVQLERVSDLIRRSAAAGGLDLDAQALTAEGFVPR
ncbi:DUF6683 family protein [Croceibacterium ferulae]|uniref:DUF6683 family protein n=1 Tax=Croceibacterium ferulae TaxID=1854641 RepID=UPI000F88C12D|nr:DUF6683 family protein [Croceibacterium ferulae]